MEERAATPVTSLLGAIDPDDHPGRIIERVMRAARDHLGLQVSFVSEFDGGHRLFRFAGGDMERFDVKIEGAEPLEDTYCQLVVDGTLDPVVNDPKSNPITAAMPVTTQLGVEVYVGVPVELSNGRVFGTLCCLSGDPEDAVAQRDVVFMRMAAAIIGEQLEREHLAAAERREKSRRILGVLGGDGLSVVYQPIVGLASGNVLGYEALARFPERPPEEWFDEAWSVGLGIDLELAAIEAALRGLDELPWGTYLSVNLSPETVLAPGLDKVLSAVPPQRVVLEITEHAHVMDYAPVRERLDELRHHGFRVAVDDLGTGHAGINHLLQFRPDVLKIDLTVVQGVRRDPIRRAIAATLSTLAASIGASIVAEGIETAEDQEALEILGLTAGQGFYIGEPARLADLAATSTSG